MPFRVTTVGSSTKFSSTRTVSLSKVQSSTKSETAPVVSDGVIILSRPHLVKARSCRQQSFPLHARYSNLRSLAPGCHSTRLGVRPHAFIRPSLPSGNCPTDQGIGSPHLFGSATVSQLLESWLQRCPHYRAASDLYGDFKSDTVLDEAAIFQSLCRLGEREYSLASRIHNLE